MTVAADDSWIAADRIGVSIGAYVDCSVVLMTAIPAAAAGLIEEDGILLLLMLLLFMRVADSFGGSVRFCGDTSSYSMEFLCDNRADLALWRADVS